MQSIGIIGGGQLGQMMVDSAKALGIKTYVLESDPKCPCSYNADELVVGNYDDIEKLTYICRNTDALTYEFENVDLGVLKALEKTFTLPQGSKILEISQNRIIEKDFARKIGFKTANYARVSNNEELRDAVRKIGYPSILKTTSGGYDGKGQFLLKSDNDLFDIDREYILEEKIEFDYEISAIGCRSENNDIVVFPLFKNEHKGGILYHTSFLQNEYFQNLVEPIMKRFMESLDYHGTLCVELFVKDKDILFNEYAPRPHNSGHMTIEGCNVSQYKNHVLGILGLPLIEPKIIHNTEMYNVLGEDIIPLRELKNTDKIIIHDYKKEIPRPKRKMGHVTFVDCERKQIESFIHKYIKESRDE